MRAKYIGWMLILCMLLTACGGNKAENVTEALSPGQVENEVETLISETVEEPAEELLEEPMEELTEVTIPEPWSLHLVMVGDVLLHDRVEESALNADGSYDFTPLFANTKAYIEAADLALVNQEVIIGGEDLGVSGYPNFNAPYAIGDELVEAGFDVICHATNHALDRNAKGILNCLEFWENEHPDTEILGIHDEEEDAYYIYEKNDVKIAILNYTYGTNGIALPSEMPFAVDLLDEEKVISDIREANEKADFTIVCPHWGTEYRLEPDVMQEKWTQIFLKNGVDLVLGTHPHVIEPVECLIDEESGNEMLVYYSLGNYVNWTSGEGAGTANRMVGGMADVVLAQDDAGQVILESYDVLPLVSHVESGYGEVTTYFLSDYTEEMAVQNEIRKQDETFSMQYAQTLCEQVWGDLYSEKGKAER